MENRFIIIIYDIQHKLKQGYEESIIKVKNLQDLKNKINQYIERKKPKKPDPRPAKISEDKKESPKDSKPKERPRIRLTFT